MDKLLDRYSLFHERELVLFNRYHVKKDWSSEWELIASMNNYYNICLTDHPSIKMAKFRRVHVMEGYGRTIRDSFEEDSSFKIL
jgi:hypothetical protein